MAQHRPAVPASVKSELLDEAAGQCSNPACPNTLIELHHIMEWAIYQTHDRAQMIALCPTCHDAVTRGELRLTDAMLYEWKAQSPQRWGGVQVPPASLHELLAGSISVTSEAAFAVFDFGSRQSLSFHLDESGRLLMINADIHDLQGKKLLEIRHNTTTYMADDVEREQRPGRFRVRLPGWQRLLPLWAYNQLLRYATQAVTKGLPVFDIEVVRAGVVRVTGIWSGWGGSVVITDQSLMFMTNPQASNPIAIEGQGEATIIHVGGPGVLFGIQQAKIVR